MSEIITAEMMWTHLKIDPRTMTKENDFMDELVDAAIARFEAEANQPVFIREIEVEFIGAGASSVTTGYRPMSNLTKLERETASGGWEEIDSSAYRLTGNSIVSRGSVFSQGVLYRATVSVGRPAEAIPDLVALIKVAVEMEYNESPRGKNRRGIASESTPAGEGESRSRTYDRETFNADWKKAVTRSGMI